MTIKIGKMSGLGEKTQDYVDEIWGGFKDGNIVDGTLGALGVEAYTGGSPYDCTPSHVPRGTRALDLIAPAEAEWPTNCEVEDNEPLCAVLRKTAVQREVLTAVCNANVIGQLEKWVDANRRSGITNMVIIAG